MSRVLAGSWAAFASLVLLFGCGKKDESPAQPASTEEEEVPASMISSGPTSIKDLVEQQKKAEQDKMAEVNRIRVQTWEANIKLKEAEGTPDSLRLAQIMRLQLEYQKLEWDPNSDPVQKQAAKDKWRMEQERFNKRNANVQQPQLDLPPDWAEQHTLLAS